MASSVLIVEDDPLSNRAVEHLFSAHVQRGTVELRCVDTADKARAELEERPAHAIVCDLYLPRRDGLQLGEELRRIAPAPLFFMGAGHIEAELKQRALKRLGAFVFSKPLELPELVTAVIAAIDGSEIPVEEIQLDEAGSFAERSPSAVLLDLWEERRSGTLTFDRGRVNKQITLRRGAPVSVQSNLRNETLGHLLVQRGKITDAQHQQALAFAQKDGGRLGRALTKLGMLKETDLLDELAAQLRHKLVSTLRWTEGTFAFEPGEPPSDRIELPFETPRLVFTGLRRSARLDEIVPRLRANPARFHLTPRLEKHRVVFEKLFGKDVLVLFAEQPLVAELVAHWDAGSLLVMADVLLASDCAALESLGEGAAATPARDPLALVELGREKPATAPAPRAGDEGLFVDPDTGPRALLERSPDALDAPTDEDAESLALPGEPTRNDVAIDPRAEELRAEILHEYLSLHAKDHYALLGVARDAATQDIALAHAAMSKRFRHDRFAGIELGRDHARLEEIVARIKLAHETLMSPDRRAVFDKTLAPLVPSGRGDGRLDAEVASHEGHARLGRGDYAGAREKLAFAVDADPEQPDYHALLGWAAYLEALGPGRESAGLDRIRAASVIALPHLETALTLDADHVDAHEYTGRIDAALGNDGDASDHLEVVLDYAPTRAEALTVLEAALARRGEWHRLEKLYRRLIHRLADDATERPLMIWWRLAELYRTRLDDLAAARVAYETVARLAPDDPRPRRALAELIRQHPTSAEDVAATMREAWSVEPEDPAPGRALFHAYHDGEQWDAALVVASALACRGASDEASAAYLKQHRPRFLVRAQGVVTDALFDAVRHGNDDRALGTLLAETFAVSEPEIALATLGVEQPLATSPPDTFARALGYAAQLLSVTAPTIYVRADFGGEIHVGGARPLVLLVGPQALASTDLLALTFRLARALSYLRPGRALAGALSPMALKDHLGAALTLAQPGMQFDDPDGTVAALRARLVAHSSALGEALRPAADTLLSERTGRIHLGRFVTGMARTADRIGLVACNDLPTAARIVGEECATGAEDELIDFALSDVYLAARSQLGLGLAV